MSGTDDEGRQALQVPSVRRSVAMLVALSLLAALAAAQLVQAWSSWQMARARPAWAGDVPDVLVSVLLTNGQVYYGELADQSAGYLRLVNVYYVQTLSAQNANQPSNQLVNRRKADWHGPRWMSIPIDRVMFVEGIGPKSRLAELIAQEKKLGTSP